MSTATYRTFIDAAHAGDASAAPQHPAAIASAPTSFARGDIRLETLAPEIRVEILSHCDPLTLAALTGASTVFDDQYRTHKRIIKRTIALRQIQHCTADVRAVTLSARSRESLQVQSGDDRLAWALDFYHGGTQAKVAVRRDEVDEVAGFYWDVVQPVALEYGRSVLKNLEARTGVASRELSVVEERRILTAMYRFQLCRNLYGFGDGADRVNEMFLFFDLFEPWEVDGLSCFYEFVEDKLIDAWHEVFPSQFTEEERQLLETPGIEHRNAFVQMLAMQGLQPIRNLMLESGRYDDEAWSFQGQSVDSELAGFMHPGYGVFNDENQFYRGTLYVDRANDHLEREELSEPMTFRSDNEGPPRAWTLLWNGTFHADYGNAVPVSLRRCGYVFWDANRVDSPHARWLIEEYAICNACGSFRAPTPF